MGPQPNSCGNPLPERACNRECSTCFNGATAKQLWKQRPHRVLAVVTKFRFNGATAKQLWKLRNSFLYNPEQKASMGPQPNSCGNSQLYRSVRPMTRLQWGHSQTAVETIPPLSDEVIILKLQWGHSQTAVETGR